jgi:hypothetical protein
MTDDRMDTVLAAIENEVRAVKSAATNGGGAAPEVTEIDGTIKALVAVLAEKITTAGNYARDHGQYIDDVSGAYAKQLMDHAEAYAQNLLAAEERKRAALEQMLGGFKRG